MALEGVAGPAHEAGQGNDVERPPSEVAARGLPAFDAVVGPRERLPGRRFAAERLTSVDLLVMADLLERERAIARTWPRGAPGPDISEERDGALRLLLAVPHGDALLDASDVTAVGFFGRLRAGVDHRVLFELERQVAATFPDFAGSGFLSYFDVGPQHGRYGNLVLFTSNGVPAAWHANPAHRRALAAAPAHYVHIRLHEGRIPGPFLGSGKLAIERTLYLDFSDARPWRGLRTYSIRATSDDRADVASGEAA
jgi:hypothetical protein